MYNEGDIIVYRTATGLRTVLVDYRDPDVKNGRPGFEGTVTEGAEKGRDVWGYDEQIVRVL